MKYVHSQSFDRNRLLEVLSVDNEVYEKNLTGSFESVSKRYKKNKEMFIFALDDEEKLCGYICFFPISEKLTNELEHNAVMFDDNISAEDVKEYAKNRRNNVFVISVALYSKAQGQGIGSALIKEMFAFLNFLSVRGYLLGNVYATTTCLQGEKLFAKFDFVNIRTYPSGARLVKYDFPVK